MIIKVLIIYMICLCICVEKISCRPEDSDQLSSFIESYTKLEGRLKNYFRFGERAGKIEKKRRKIKKALHNFFQEVFTEESNSTLTLKVLRQTAGFYHKDGFKTQISAVQQILDYGYRVESHTIETVDGYMLRLHRLLPASVLLQSTPARDSIILYHGLMGSSDDWLLLGPKKALAYLLTDAGYDVWLMNARGNKYSRSHITYSTEFSEFWDFSFHEMGTIDLPAVIDYVKNKIENDSEIHFVGFSMGATAVLVLLSTQPKYNRVLKSVTLLAPLAFMHQIKGPLKLLAEFLEENNANSLDFLGVNEFMRTEAFPQRVVEKYCKGDSSLCLNPLLLIANGGKEIENENVLSKVLDHFSEGTSMKTIKHYLQIINSGHFRMYENSPEINWKKYGEKLPPDYKLVNVNLHIVMFSSINDWLATNRNVLKLWTMLPNVTEHHVIRNNDFTHTDFIWGDDAPNLVFNLVLKMLEKLRDDEEK